MKVQLPRAKGNLKDGRTAPLITRIGQGKGSMWFSRNRSTSSLSEFEISHTLRSSNPWEGTPKGAINGKSIPTMRRRDTKSRIVEL